MRSRWHLTSGAAAVCLGLAGLAAMPIASSAATSFRGTTITLCPSSGAAAGGLAKAQRVIAKRVQKGFRFKRAVVTITHTEGGLRCLTVTLPHAIAWLRWLADDISGKGTFGLGVTQPNPKQQLQLGSRVRLPHEPVNSSNSSLPIVRVVMARPGVERWTVKIETRNSATYVAMSLRPKASRHFCSFTTHHAGDYVPVVLDHQVVSEPSLSAGICGGNVLVGFPSAKSLDRPLGPRQVVAEVRAGLLPVSLTVSSLA